MSHVLLRKKFSYPDGKLWMFHCTCGKMFGALCEKTIEDCIGDTLDAHRQHVRDELEHAMLAPQRFGFSVLDPAKGAVLANRAWQVNLRLHEIDLELRGEKAPEGPVIFPCNELFAFLGETRDVVVENFGGPCNELNRAMKEKENPA